MRLLKTIKVCMLVFLALTLLPFATSKAILNKPSGWYAGDQHVHSHYSCARWPPYTGDPHSDTTIEENANAAKYNNFDWMIITDHGPMIPNCYGGWDNLKTECDAEDSSSFKCMRGEEVGYCDHLLAYDSLDLTNLVGSHWTEYPSDTQDEIDDITSQGGMATIAHPFNTGTNELCYTLGWGDTFDWDNWGNTGWKGLEIRNGPYTSDDIQAYEKWQELIGEGKKISAIGNSDAHRTADMGTSFTYCRMSSLTEGNIETALKYGRCVEGSGPLVTATFEGAKIGQEVSLCAGTYDLYINAYSDSSTDNDLGELYAVYVYVNNEYVPGRYLSGYTDQKTIPITVTPGTRFIRLTLKTTKDYWAYTNPIWINMLPCEAEVCYDGVDNDNDNLVDCADTADCPTGTKSQNGFCCSGIDASTSGFSCSDGECDTYSEACQNGELESSLVCSGTSLSCSDGNCEYNFGAPQWCDEIIPGGSVCENSPGSYDELACELTGTNCYYEAETNCNAPSGCDEKNEDQCSNNNGLQCEWQNGYKDDVVEECDSICGAVSDCDEKDPGANLNKCIGISYYEEECSNGCQYQDITSIFECTDAGCSCSESLCDGLTTGSSIQTCSAGETYFADKCTLTAGGEDRGDNICRSSIFASGCSAASECNGIVAGTGGCSATCNANQPTSIPTTLLCDDELCTNNGTFSNSIEINCSGSIDAENNFITYFIDAYYNSTESGGGWWRGDEPIGYWKMNEPDDGITYNVTDSSIYGQIGNNSNQVWFTTGKLGNSANFSLNSLSNSYLSIGEYHSLYELNESFTIVAWVNNTDTTTTRYIVSVAETMLGTGMWALGISSASQTAYWNGADSSNGLLCRINENGTINVNDGNWHRVVLIRDGNTDTNSLKIYIDGELSNTTDCPSAYNFTGYAWDGDGEFRIGSPEAGGYAIEAVDDVQLWNITWSASDVETDWNNGIGREADEFGGAAWHNIGNHSEISVLNWDVSEIQPQSEVDLKCRAIDLQGSNTFSNYYAPLINLTIALPNDTSKFYIKNDSDDTIAWLGNEGNIVLRGKCNVMSDCIASSENLFVIGNSTDNVVAYINSSGDLCIEKGDCVQDETCTEKNAFKIRNSTQDIVNYIDFDGELCFTGGLYENANL